jgi:EPS-associated MarR family transcriptional regulator
MTQDQQILSVLESLSRSADMPQRKIAQHTGLNLAKVNFVLRKLKDKGFIKLKRVRDNPHKLKYLYLLTPDGLAEKSRLTYRFLKKAIAEYNQAESVIEESVQTMLADGIRRVVLWGNNEITKLFLKITSRLDNKIRVCGIVDPSGRNPDAIKPEKIGALAVDAVVACEGEVVDIPDGVRTWRLV